MHAWKNFIFISKWMSLSHFRASGFSSVAQSCLTLQPHESQHARPACPSPTPGVHSDSRPSSHLTLGHPLLLLPSIPPSIRVFSNGSTLRMRWPKYCSFSFSIIPSEDHQDWSPSEWTCWISLQSKGLSRVFSNITASESLREAIKYNFVEEPRHTHTKKNLSVIVAKPKSY